MKKKKNLLLSWLLCVQEWLINEKKLDVFGMKLPTGFQLIGQVVCIPSFLAPFHLSCFVIFTQFCLCKAFKDRHSQR